MREPWMGVAHRRILEVLRARCAEEPVVALLGPRSVGKSRLLAEFAVEHGVDIVDLDDPSVLEAVMASPNLAVQGRTPVCIDEYQRAPQVLDALKALINTTGSVGGTAVLTGSTRHDALPRTAQALTGRLHVLPILPLSQGEIDGQREDLLVRMLSDPERTVAAHPVSLTLRNEYIERVCAGGFPPALRRTGPARDRWFDDYTRLSIERDVLELSRVQQREVLRQLLERLASQTGQVLNMKKAGADLAVRHETVETYARLLEDLFLVQRLPAWGSTLRARATSSPKLHLVDSGLAARLLRLSPARLASLDATAITEFGHLLETFVVNELRKQVSWMEESVAVGHWRTHDGDEVDLVVENDEGHVLAFEVKSGDRVSSAELKGLRKLREAVGPRFLAGAVLYAGTLSYSAEDRLHVMPIDRLWRST